MSDPTSGATHVVIVDDDHGYASCLAEVLVERGAFQLVGVFGSPEGFRKAMDSFSVDLAILDIEMPTMRGTDLLPLVKERWPEVKVVMLTVFDDDELILTAIRNGADGYLLKDSTPTQIIRALRDTLRGGVGMSPHVGQRVLSFIRDQGENEADARRRIREYGINGREEEVLRRLAAGDRYSDIAVRLSIAKDTVKTHVKAIYDKLGVNNKVAAIQKVGLVGPDR